MGIIAQIMLNLTNSQIKWKQRKKQLKNAKKRGRSRQSPLMLIAT
jgi:hypothetical protein